MIDFRLYLITDHLEHAAKSLETAAYEACDAGARALQLREKTIHASSLYHLAQALRRITALHGARLLVNDRADIARAAGADGVHCPENGLAPPVVRRIAGDHAIVGVSTHSIESARAAERSGADFITFGPVFETASKMKYGPPQGLEKLREVTAAVGLPVFALGGVTPERAASCIEHGAWGVAVISAVFGAGDVGRAVGEFERALGGL